MGLIFSFRRLRQFWRQERRLPSRFANNRFFMSCLYIWLQFRSLLNAILGPKGIDCVVRLPIAKHRYCTYLLFALQQTYTEILLVWDPSIHDLQALFSEGRRIFSMKGVHFMNTRAYLQLRLQSGSYDYVTASDGAAPHIPANRIFDIQTNLSQLPVENSYLFPYGPHPNNFRTRTHVENKGSNFGQREIRIFFSGTIEYSTQHDHRVMERIYDLPNRRATIQELKRIYPSAVWIDDAAKRSEFDSGKYAEQIQLCFATVKGDPRKWLSDLRRADFFLCLPGSHMPMCHNAVEAISMGCIPILCYENWFIPNLIPGLQCLSYRNFNDLYTAIDSALLMSPEEIQGLRSNVWTYYDRYLNCITAAERVFGRSHTISKMTVYLNQEEGENYVAAKNADSVLYKGGTLQSLLDGYANHLDA